MISNHQNPIFVSQITIIFRNLFDAVIGKHAFENKCDCETNQQEFSLLLTILKIFHQESTVASINFINQFITKPEFCYHPLFRKCFTKAHSWLKKLHCAILCIFTTLLYVLFKFHILIFVRLGINVKIANNLRNSCLKNKQ